jgi:cellulose synthase/poly-beta-1,6-N-acetylglucosamine synthase-like glycosyltransferase/peptidoglycan/xylan/chitin deacetylase (PgdA/CDA1 family)
MSTSNQVFFEPTGKRWLVTKIAMLIVTVLLIAYFAFLFSLWKTNKRDALISSSNEYRTQYKDRKNLGINFYPSLLNQYNYFKENFESIERVNCFCGTFNFENDKNIISYTETEEFNLINIYRKKAKAGLNKDLKPELKSDLNQDLNLVIPANSYSKFNSTKDIEFDIDQALFKSIILEVTTLNQQEVAFASKLTNNGFNVSLLVKGFETITLDKDITNISNFYLKLDDAKSKDSDYAKQIGLFTELNRAYNGALKLNLITPSQAYQVLANGIDPYNQKTLETLITTNNIKSQTVDNSSQASSVTINSAKYINFDDQYYYNLLNSFKTSKLDLQIASININNPGNAPNGIPAIISDYSKLNENYKFNTFIDKKDEGKGVILNYTEGKAGVRTIQYNLDGQALKVDYSTYPTKSLLEYKGQNNNNIAITFDDGPDPVITDKVLNILKDKSTKATFYLVGANAAKYPEIVKRIVREGHQIGNHSYSHAGLSNLQDQAIKDEIQETQNILKQITGEYPKYVRTPFNDSPYHSIESDLRIAKIAQELGLKVSEFDTDPRDWEIGKSADEIYALSTNSPKSQLLLHDAGKLDERQGFLNALPKILDFYKERNIETVTTNVLFENKEVTIKDSSFDVSSYLTPSFILTKTKLITDSFILGLTILSLFFLILVRILWVIQVNKKEKEFKPYTPPVSIIIPSFNEESVCIATVESLIAQNYPDYEVIFVDDGSKDRSYEILKIKYILNKRIKIFKKENGGKATALNFGIAKAIHGIVILVDADTQFKKDSIHNLARHFQDPKIGAVAGNVQVGNDYFTQKENGVKNPKFNLLTVFQRIEYITSQNFFREAFELVNIITIVSGAIGAYRKSAIYEAGGISTDTLAEDGNLSFDVLKNGWKIVYERDAISLTEAPEDLKSLFKQRIRWAFGNIQVLWKNRKIMFNPKKGWLGMVAMPFAWNCFIGLVISPFISIITFGYAFYDIIVNNRLTADSKLIWAAAFWYLMFILIELVVLFLAIYRDPSKSKFRLIPFFFVYTFTFPIFLFIVSIQVIVKIFSGRPQGWGYLKRTGTVTLKAQ